MTEALAQKVTVGIVAYNHADWVIQAMESTRLERPGAILVSDDASPDDTQALIRRWVSALPPKEQGRTTPFLSQVNQGLCHRLNEQLEATSTEYFAYLAGDDVHVRGRLERQVAFMDSTGVALSYGDAVRLDASGNTFDQSFYELHKEWADDIATDDPFATLLLGGGNWIPAPTVMFRTEALKAVGGFDPAIAFEDYDAYSRIAGRFEIGFVPSGPLAAHRELENSLGTKLFTPNNLRWTEGRARTELKALGVRADLDERIAHKAFVRVIQAGKLGADPRWVYDSLGTVGAYLQRRPAAWYWYRAVSRAAAAMAANRRRASASQ